MAKRSNISPEEFVRIWQGAKNSNEAYQQFQELGLSKAGANARATTYRNKGVELKRFQRGRASLDITALNNLAKSIGDE